MTAYSSIMFHSPLKSKTSHAAHFIFSHVHETRWHRGKFTMTRDSGEVVEPGMEISSFGISQCNYLSCWVFCLFGWANSELH